MAAEPHPSTTDIAVWAARGRPDTGIGDHLRGCPECSAVEHEWRAVHGALSAWAARLPEPRPLELPAVALGRHRTEGWIRVRQAVAVVATQVTVVRRQVWAATALVVGLGCLVLTVSGAPAGPLFALLAPMGAACGMALIYGREADPAYEISRASPVSMRTVLVARLVVVTGYDLVVGFLGTVLVSIGGAGGNTGGLGSLLWAWLGPMLLLSALSVLLSVLFRPWLGIAVALLLWALRVAVLSPSSPVHATVLAVGLRWVWTTNPAVLATALVVTALAVTAVGRREERMA